MSRLHVIEHPLVQHKLTMIRDKTTGSKEFRDLLDEMSCLMAYEVTRDLPVADREVETPLGSSRGQALAGKAPVLVPILRAGLGMMAGILTVLPTAQVGHVGVYRNEETLQPVEYYCKLPAELGDRQLIVLDPMLATGGSARAAITFIKERGGGRIKLMALVAAPEGVRSVESAHPDVDIYVAGLDEGLDQHGYILPGLGDAGDRLYGTH